MFNSWSYSLSAGLFFLCLMIFNFGPSGDRITLGLDFPRQSKPTMGSDQPPPNWCRLSFLRVKRPVHGADHPPHQSPKLMNISKILLPLCAFMACSKVTFTFTCIFTFSLPTFILLIYIQGLSTAVWVAFFECDLPFKGQLLLHYRQF